MMVGHGKSQRNRLFEQLEARALLSAAISDVKLLTADLDGDGADEVILFENLGENTTAATRATPWKHHDIQGLDAPTIEFTHALTVHAADFNGDGKADLLFSRRESGTGNILYSIGYTDGGVTDMDDWRTQALKGPIGTVVGTGDINGDGKADLLVKDGDRITVRIGKGDGSFPARRSFVLPHVLEVNRVADFNKDGRPDLAYTIDDPKIPGPGPDGIAIALGNNKGGFDASPKGAFVIPHVLDTMVADFDGDHQLDYAIVSPRDPQSGQASGKRMHGFTIDSTGSLVPVGVADLPDSPPLATFAAGDISGDHKAELLAAGTPITPNQGPARGGTIVYAVSNPLYQQSGNQGVNPLFESNKRVVGNEECDDGSVNIVTNWDDIERDVEIVRIHNTGDITTGPSVVEVFNPNSKGETRKTFILPHVLEAHVADFNGDGAADVLALHREAGTGQSTGRRDRGTGQPTGQRQRMSIYFNDGNGNLDTTGTRYATDPYVETIVAVGDLNGDGRADLIIHRDLAARNVLQPLISKGDGSFEQRKSFVLPHVLESKGIADFTGDGIVDFAYTIKSPRDSASGQATGKRTHSPRDAASGQASGVAIVAGIGEGNFGQVWTYDSPTPVLDVVVGDLDGDGRADAGVIGGPLGGIGGKVSLTLVNYGPAGLAAGKPIALPDSFAIARRIQAADLNGDGRLDLVVAGLDGILIGLNQPGMRFTEGVISANGVKFCDVAVGDLDGDGDLDLFGFAGDDVLVARNIAKPGGDLEFSPWKWL